MGGGLTQTDPQTFLNPVRIHFGTGTLDTLPELVGQRRCIVVTTEGMARRGTLARVERGLGRLLAGTHTGVVSNPTVASCLAAAGAVRDTEADVLVALGGGSAIDTAKALAAQRASGQDGWLSRHLRHGAGVPEAFGPLPIIGVPTTAGTGSEVTMWGTVWDERTARKHSISHPRLYPEAALVDPSLTLSLPRVTTAATALDALSHGMEAIWNRSANPVSDALAVRAIGIIPGALRRALDAPDDLAARESLAAGALLAGLAMSNTRTALAHSISYPLTAELGLQHGFACSLTLPEILREVGGRFPERAELITGALRASSVEDAVEMLYALFRFAGMPAEVRRQIPGAAALNALRTSFITRGRADNAILDVDQAFAAALLRRAHAAISPD